ncbi:Sel1 repeat-containing protein [Palleronia aestuarii]|uniref:Sel1 repeat-containing protein n=1 Tax=Palleronia aestuarii TaxID=568105 RepID=A0A2W7NES5_9RHOB|nr:tetratricopeptide repeat protein [Palleronia aestuarii]PZX18925.1 Sel1 repeat-containing protein [Palleronia aestuarii]
MRRSALLLALALLGPSDAFAETGAEAFARRDFTTARALWQEELSEGSPEAAQGLGALSDLGLGVPRDPERAFRYYLIAADAGLAEAQFNVAVMLDSGTVQVGNSGAAALWYGRAAANGYARAEYNLGIMFEQGDGVDANADLARFWMARAGASIEAARDRLGGIGPAIAPHFETPRILGGVRVDNSDDAPRAELVWSAPPAEPGSAFLVQLMRLGSDLGSGLVVEGIETEASALSVPLPSEDAAFAWRVARLDRDGRAYAASSWTPLDPIEGDFPSPRAFVAFQIAPDDEDARRLSEALSRDLAANGIWSHVEKRDEMPESSSVLYTFDRDRDLASDIMAFLPALRDQDVLRAEFIGPEPRPGEIVVRLVGGLSLG